MGAVFGHDRGARRLRALSAHKLPRMASTGWVAAHPRNGRHDRVACCVGATLRIGLYLRISTLPAAADVNVSKATACHALHNIPRWFTAEVGEAPRRVRAASLVSRGIDNEPIVWSPEHSAVGNFSLPGGMEPASLPNIAWST